MFVAVGTSGVGNRVMTSPDGITWATRTSASNSAWLGISWAPELGIFVAVAEVGQVMTSKSALQIVSAGEATFKNTVVVPRLGVGTGNPSKPVHIYGNVHVQKGGNGVGPTELRIGNNGLDSGSDAGLLLGATTDTGGYSFNPVAFIDTHTGGVSGNPPLVFRTRGTERMRITDGGNVGIGTTAPQFPLHVFSGGAQVALVQRASIVHDIKVINTIGSAIDQVQFSLENLDTTWINYIQRSAGSLLKWYNSNVGADRMTLTTGGALGISGALTQNSDRRIKKDIRDLVDEEALETLRQIKPVAYRYVDPADRDLPEDHPEVIGFIAQDIAAVLPNAVSKKTQFVPSVMSGGTLVDVDVISIHNSEILPFEVDARVNIRWTDVESGKIRHGIVRCTEIDVFESTFRFVPDPMNMTGVKPEEFPSTIGMEVFVKGHEVDDFHVLDKSAIFTVVAAATQELDRQLQAAKAETAGLRAETEAETESLRAEIEYMKASFEARLAALEAS
jgi:hypothetical protein